MTYDLYVKKAWDRYSAVPSIQRHEGKVVPLVNYMPHHEDVLWGVAVQFRTLISASDGGER